jgi:hypothetical protein
MTNSHKSLSLQIVAQIIYSTMKTFKVDLNKDLKTQLLELKPSIVIVNPITLVQAISIRDTFKSLVSDADILILQNNTSGNLENMFIESTDIILQHVFKNVFPHIVKVAFEHFSEKLTPEYINNYHHKEPSKAISSIFSNIYDTNARLSRFLSETNLINKEHI